MDVYSLIRCFSPCFDFCGAEAHCVYYADAENIIKICECVAHARIEHNTYIVEVYPSDGYIQGEQTTRVEAAKEYVRIRKLVQTVRPTTHKKIENYYAWP